MNGCKLHLNMVTCFYKIYLEVFKMVSDIYELDTVDMLEASKDGDCADPETGSENCGCEDF